MTTPTATATPATSENPAWFATEVQPHGSALRAYLRARFPWLRDVDDVVQESLFRFLRHRRTAIGRPEKPPKATLFTIARNAAFDQARRRAIVEMNSVAEFDQLSVIDENVDVAETVCTRQELEFLADALRELPDGCRRALTLCKMYGYTPKEIADQLGISEHTVRAQVAKGVRRCAEYLRYREVTRMPR